MDLRSSRRYIVVYFFFNLCSFCFFTCRNLIPINLRRYFTFANCDIPWRMNIELPNGHAKLNGRNYTHPSWQGALRVWGRRYKETQSNGCVEATNHNYELKLVSVREYWWARRPVEILVFPSPTGYMLTSFGSSLWIEDVFSRFLQNDRWFLSSLERFIFKLKWVAGSPH